MARKRVAVIPYSRPDLVPANLKKVAGIFYPDGSEPAGLLAEDVTLFNAGDTIPDDLKKLGMVEYAVGATIPDNLQKIAAIGYLFSDEFGGAAVDTAKWTVTDTENKITVANGLLTFAGGLATPAWADPALVSVQSWARVAGLTFECEVTPGATNKIFNIGLTDGTLAAGGVEAHNYQFGASALIEHGSGAAYAVTPYTYAAASYRLRIVCLATGALYYVSSDSGLTWKLIWADAAVTTDPLYAFVESYNAALTVGFIRILKTAVKAPVLQDGFTRSNAALGSADIGGAYVFSQSAWTIVTNKGYNTPSGDGVEQETGTLVVGKWYKITATMVPNYFYQNCLVGQMFRATTDTPLDPQHKVQQYHTGGLFAKLTSQSTDGVADCAMLQGVTSQAGMVLRWQDNDNFLIAYVNKVTGEANFDKCVAGTYTNLLNGAVTYGAAKVLRVVLNGTVARVYYDGTEVGTGATVPASTSKVHGLFSTDGNNGFTSFKWQEGIGV